MYGFPMLKIRRSFDRLIINILIHILVRQHIYTETPPDDFYPQIVKRVVLELLN